SHARGGDVLLRHHRSVRTWDCGHGTAGGRDWRCGPRAPCSRRRRRKMNLNSATLARVQFAFTVSFHIIFPTTSIGLAMFLSVVEGLWLKTSHPVYLQIYRFWLGLFGMAFGVGVVTGIVLSFEFGLGFAHFAQIAGPV